MLKRILAKLKKSETQEAIMDVFFFVIKIALVITLILLFYQFADSMGKLRLATQEFRLKEDSLISRIHQLEEDNSKMEAIIKEGFKPIEEHSQIK